MWPCAPPTECWAVRPIPRPAVSFLLLPSATVLTARCCVASVGNQPSCLYRTAPVLALKVPRPRRPLSLLQTRTWDTTWMGGIRRSGPSGGLQGPAPHQEIVSGSAVYAGVRWGVDFPLLPVPGEGLNSGHESPRPLLESALWVLLPRFLREQLAHNCQAPSSGWGFAVSSPYPEEEANSGPDAAH